MLLLTLPAIEGWDEKKEEFVDLVKETTLQLEHSLVSISKWESKWHKPFLLDNNKTDVELMDYIKCMTVTQNVKPETYERITADQMDQIRKYINDPMTATTFSDEKENKRSREIVTAEIIYQWMIALQIPPQYEKWHLNKLLTLIKVCNIKSQPPKKQNKRDILLRNSALNEARRKKLNSKG